MVDGNPSLLLSYLSPDGEENYPGNLQAFVRYTLTREAELIIDYKATSDKTTIYNPTNHSYFNLQGHGAGKILQHQIQINADHFTPVDKKLIPLGHLLAVDGTAMDLRKQKSIEDGIDDKFTQIQLGGGYDHNWVLNKTPSSEWSKAAEVFEPSSGRVMEVFTTEPGIQFYSGNFLSEMTGKQGKTYLHRGGFCLETQHFPDSPNQKSFPTTVLRPDEEFSSRTMYKFSTR